MTTRPHSLWWIVGGIVSACALSLISAAYLWRAFIAPLTQAPHTRLVLTGPRGTVGVMWIKLPLLAAFLLGYLWLLFVARKSLRLSSFPIAAGSLFVLCAIAGYVVWDHGAASRLQGSTPIILLHCFNVFAGIIAGAAALPQVLLAMIFRRKLQNIS
jgi:hypothetical protein